MGDLRRKAPDGCETLRLNKTLFHRPQIGTVLKDVNELSVVAVTDTLNGHVDDLPLAVPGENDNGFVQAASGQIRLPYQFIVNVPQRAELPHLPAFQTQGRGFKNSLGSRTGFDDRSVAGRYDQTFVHASHALLRLYDLLADIFFHGVQTTSKASALPICQSGSTP
jgi:hypothetical protein